MTRLLTTARIARHATLAALALTCMLPASSQARGPLSLMMDDDLLLYSPDATRDSSLDFMKQAGVDGIRVTVAWKFVSGEESGRPVRKPRRFAGRGAENPRNYRADIWDRFDRVVRGAYGRGMVVMFNVTGPGPVWAHARAPRSRRFDQLAWKPNVAEFRKFVVALGRRYSGGWRDENDGNQILPRVTIWSIFNEVNQPASLSPQIDYDRRLRRQIPVAPILYRDLYYAATSALRQTGHRQDTILMGETAPLGAVRNTVRVHLWPKLFIRELLCIAPNGRPYRGLEARVRRCDKLRRNGPFLVSGFAHHPYTQRSPPTRRDRDAGSINLANLGDLPRLLDDLAARTGLIPRNLPIWLTEAGWETLPPDPTRGVSPQAQARYINIAQRLSYDQPRVIAETQFIFRDVKPRARYRGRPNLYWATWQSGLLFANGRPKPALFAYLMPFDVMLGAAVAQGRALRFWGQLRFLPKGQSSQVRLEFRGAGSQQWVSGAPIEVNDPLNFYDVTIPSGTPGVWRAVWEGNGATLTSREVSVSF
jgi:hypothetical protein